MLEPIQEMVLLRRCVPFIPSNASFRTFLPQETADKAGRAHAALVGENGLVPKWI
jgi:hypothetical protein